MNDFWRELRDHWNDSYWWADHQELKAALIAAVGGIVGLLFVWLELELRARYEPPGAPPSA